MRPVDDDQWLVVQHFESTRHFYRRQTLFKHIAMNGFCKEHFYSGDCGARIVTLVPAMKWNENIAVQRIRRAHVDESPA